ncbi:unnamed protein product [Ranitomeya imitator]|uniref:Helix-turn-helix domain-containing protein n=1 Tax=Ranitomeya imitator TaxID=111125 RepID=A0ABN9MBX9_9NEOB|nr:unnamed protein product [Ranitomeya imitator]
MFNIGDACVVFGGVFATCVVSDASVGRKKTLHCSIFCASDFRQKRRTRRKTRAFLRAFARVFTCVARCVADAGRRNASVNLALAGGRRRGISLQNVSREGAHRYIDDVFFVWLGTETECVQFLQDLNTNVHNIFLTHLMSTTSVTYLDLRIMAEDRRLATDLFRKSTATNALLEYSSFHPTHTKVGVPISQFLRVRCNCTHDVDFLSQAQELTNRFRQRGYPKRVISSAFQRARREHQASLLTSRPRNTDKANRFVTDYNNSWHQVTTIINRHWSILRTDSQTAEVTSDRPLLAMRRAPNLRDLLTQSHFTRPTVRLNRGLNLKGSFPCGDCNVCSFMIPTRNIFFNPVDSSTHRLKHYINCKTRDVIYVIICPCGKPYVGQTSQELRKRIQKHMSTIHLAAAEQRKGISAHASMSPPSVAVSHVHLHHDDGVHFLAIAISCTLHAAASSVRLVSTTHRAVVTTWRKHPCECRLLGQNNHKMDFSIRYQCNQYNSSDLTLCVVY